MPEQTVGDVALTVTLKGGKMPMVALEGALIQPELSAYTE